MRRICHDGVESFPGSVRYRRAPRSTGLQTTAASSSADCAEVLNAARIVDLFLARIDGVSVEQRRLAAKATPATAKVLGVEPGEAAVFEDALSGVAAGRAGGFGCVVGVGLVGEVAQQRGLGADRVVTEPAHLPGLVVPA